MSNNKINNSNNNNSDNNSNNNSNNINNNRFCFFSVQKSIIKKTYCTYHILLLVSYFEKETKHTLLILQQWL